MYLTKNYKRYTKVDRGAKDVTKNHEDIRKLTKETRMHLTKN